MTRFDAATADSRTELFVDAIRAHDERDSAFLTVEADDATIAGKTDGEPAAAPWVQFADGIVNLDCTDDELSRGKSLLDDYAEFRIDDLARPEDAEGVNLKIAARTDPERVASFIDRVFCEVYKCPADYRAWVTVI